MFDSKSLGGPSPSLRPAMGDSVIRSRREAPRTPLGPQPQHEQNLTLLRQLRGRWSSLLGSESAAQVSQEAATYLNRLAPQENIQGRELRLLQQMTAGTARPTLTEEGVAQQADPRKAIKDLDRKIKSLSARLSEGGESSGSAKVSRAELQIYGSLHPMKTGTYQGVKTELRSHRETEGHSETLAQRPEVKTATQGSAAQGSLSEVVQNRTTVPWSRHDKGRPAQPTVTEHENRRTPKTEVTENRKPGPPPQTETRRPEVLKPPVETRRPEVPKPPVETRRPEVPKPPVETRRPEVPKPPVETRRPEVPKPPVETRRPEVPKPPVETRKPLGPPPEVETRKPLGPPPQVDTRKPVETRKPLGPPPEALGPPPQVDARKPEVPRPPVDTPKAEVPRPPVDARKPEVPRPPVDTRKPEVPQPPVDTRRPQVPQPPVDTRKPEVPQPPVDTRKPEVPQPPLDTRRPEVPRPPVDARKPEVPQPPVDTRRPEVPQPPVETRRPQVPQPPVETRRPEVPRPPVDTRKPDVPRPPVDTRKPEVPQPPLDTRKPEVPRPPVDTRKPEVPRPPVDTRRPEVPQPPVDTRRPEVPRPPLDTRKPEVPRPPLDTRKPEVPRPPVDTPRPEVPQPPVDTRRPEVPRPPLDMRKPEVPRPPVDTRRPEVPQPPVDTRRPEVPQPRLDTPRAEVPQPRVDTRRPEVPRPPVDTRKPEIPQPRVEPRKPEVSPPPIETPKQAAPSDTRRTDEPLQPARPSLATPREIHRPALGPPPSLPANEPAPVTARTGPPPADPPKIESPKAEAAPIKLELSSKKEPKPAVKLPPVERPEDKPAIRDRGAAAIEEKPAFAPVALAPVTSVKATSTTQAAENRSKYPDWLQVKLSEDATPAYLTSLPGAQRGPKGIEAQPITHPRQAVDAVKVDYRRADLRDEPSAPVAIAQQVAAPPPTGKAAQLFQSVLSQGLIASQKPPQDAPKSSESPSRSRLDEEKDKQRDGIKGVAPTQSRVAGAGRISGQSEIIETRGLQAALSGSVGRREGAEQKAPMPNVAAGWGSAPAQSDAKLDNGRVVSADIPVYSPVLDELAERSKEAAPQATAEREKPRPLFFERSEDNFHEQRFKEEDRGGREALERSGTLPQAFHTAEKQVASKRRDEVDHDSQRHQDKIEDVNDQSGHGGRGGGSQQRERDQQASKNTQQAAEQQQTQRRGQNDQKMDLRSLEAYRLAKTDEALKLGLKLAQQPEGKQLSELVNRNAGHSMESLLKKAYRLDSLGELSRDDAVNALGLVLKLGGEFTFAHSARVLELAMDLADEVGVTDKHTRSQVRLGALLKDTGEMALMLDEAPPAKLEKITDWLGSQDLRQAGLLHDIGKTKVPPEILYKPGKLTEEEYEIMKLHPVLGEQMVYPIESLRHLCPVIRGHHERWDGKGYPDGLKGEDIPYAARIIAVADVFDALAAERPYKAGMPVERVQAILREGRGTHFDPDLLDAFERVIQRRHPELSNPFA